MMNFAIAFLEDKWLDMEGLGSSLRRIVEFPGASLASVQLLNDET